MRFGSTVQVLRSSLGMTLQMYFIVWFRRACTRPESRIHPPVWREGCARLRMWSTARWERGSGCGSSGSAHIISLGLVILASILSRPGTSELLRFCTPAFFYKEYCGGIVMVTSWTFKVTLHKNTTVHVQKYESTMTIYGVKRYC